MGVKEIIAAGMTAFGLSACMTPPVQQRQEGELVTDPSGCTYWKNKTDNGDQPKPCILKVEPATPKQP